MNRILALACAVAAVSACSDHKDYDARSACLTMGYKAGQSDFDKCVKDERASRMMIEQQKAFEQRQQDIEDWHKRGY